MMNLLIKMFKNIPLAYTYYKKRIRPAVICQEEIKLLSDYQGTICLKMATQS